MKTVLKIIEFSVLAVSFLSMAVSCQVMSDGYGDMNVGSTVLIYMAADNNLSYNAKRDIEEMKKGNLPYYFDEGTGNVLLVYADISGETPKLMRLSRDRFGTANTEVLMEYEDRNSCSDSVMRSVLEYAAGLFPSDNNGLVLWSHGTGWLPESYYSQPYYAGADGAPVFRPAAQDPYAGYVKSFGSEDGVEMDIRSLADALPVHYSFILFDACLMGGVEVAYELKDKCDYFIGSAAEILADGFPYDKVISDFFDGRQGLENACRKYYEHYKDNGATVSMVDTRRLNALAESCLDIFLAGRAAIGSLDMDSVQGYFRMDRHWFYDLGDFVSRIASEENYRVFSEAMDNAVICKWHTEMFVIGGVPQFPIKTFSGLSTYIPNPENSVLDEYYRTLDWNKAVRMVE